MVDDCYLLFKFHALYELRFSDFYHVILGCDETTPLASFSWNSVITPTMASAHAKFEDFFTI